MLSNNGVLEPSEVLPQPSLLAKLINILFNTRIIAHKEDPNWCQDGAFV